MSKLIKPRTLAGFRDFLPATMIPREALIDTAKKVYRSYGFSPIDTPVLELYEVLTGKGSDETDKQMYQFRDNGDRHVGMRFDLTVPLARFVAQHHNDLGMPFRRYHIGEVWRGEKAQAGRYREFMQCDFDTVGTKSIASDIETGMVIFDLLRAIGFERFQIRVNNRKVLNGLLDKFGLAEDSVPVLRAIDKLEKMGRDKVCTEIKNKTSATDEQVNDILQLTELDGNNEEVLTQLMPICQGNELAEEGLDELQQLASAMKAVGIDESNLSIDVSIARGLDYYTGTIFETLLGDYPEIGSVCSGGRYDNLAQLYTRQELPGVGASLGLDRLLAAMEKLEMVPTISTPADVLVVQFSKESLNSCLVIGNCLRKAGIATEVYPAAKKLAAQFKYAERRGFKAVIVAGQDEIAKGVVQVKLLDKREQHEVPFDGQDATTLSNWLRENVAGS
jgi:histidyl-tRNA synthetase